MTSAPAQAPGRPGAGNGANNTRFAALFDAVTANVAQVLQGKQQSIELAVMCLLAEGHLLIEDVPGVGKTSLAKAMATSIDCTWKRVQFTPDLLPADLVGVGVYQRSSESFRFQPGPLFANIVLADEINRASPKERFRIHFDSWALQSRLEDRLPELLPRLDTYERDGALWARSSEYGDEQDPGSALLGDAGADVPGRRRRVPRRQARARLRSRCLRAGRRPPRHPQLVRGRLPHARGTTPNGSRSCCTSSST